jgi:hypothetical protein
MRVPARSPVMARVLEAFIGGATGAGVGGTAGALSYKTKAPTEWTDERGDVQARKLTKEEKADRRENFMQGALIGMGIGATGANVGSILRRFSAARGEAAQLGATTKQYVGPLQDYARKLQIHSAVESSHRGLADALRGRQPSLRVVKPDEIVSAQRLEAARTLLGQREQKIRDLLSVAQANRERSLFGGLRQVGGSRLSTGPQFTPMSHQGLIEQDLFGGHEAAKRTLMGNPEGYYREMVEKMVRGR